MVPPILYKERRVLFLLLGVRHPLGPVCCLHGLTFTLRVMG